MISSDQALRVYHSGNTAMELMQTGEKKLKILLPRIFSDCRSFDYEGVLVFGSGFLAGEKILANSMGGYAEVNKPRRIRKKNGELLSSSNTGNPLYYLPLRQESLAILRLIRYRDWQDWLKDWTIQMVQRWPQQCDAVPD